MLQDVWFVNPYGSLDNNLKIRDETYEAESYPWAPASDSVCTDSKLSKRASPKPEAMTLSWSGTFGFASYPSCPPQDLSPVGSISISKVCVMGREGTL